MPLVTLSQYKDLISKLSDPDYQPIRDRNISDSPAGELYNKSGNRIVSSKLKFYLEDDGGDWTRDNLYKPQFIWDMKKISGKAVIDDGSYSQNLDLLHGQIQETDDGLRFLQNTNSFLRTSTTYSLESLFNNKNVLLNIWFRPSFPEGSPIQNLFGVYAYWDNAQTYNYGSVVPSVPIMRIWLTPKPVSDSTFMLYFLSYCYSGNSNILISDELKADNLNNLQIHITSSGILKFYLNGILMNQYTGSSYSTILNHSNQYISIGERYRGELSYISMNVDSNSYNFEYIKKLYALKYPLPRGNELVDLSDVLETKGQNLLIDDTNIKKVIENFKGQFYVKTNSLRLRNG